MGIRRSKPWIPDKYFVTNCKKQGFVAISPPVYLSKKEIHTIDLGFDNAVYYVQRRKKDLSVKWACPASIDMLREEVILIYKENGKGGERGNEPIVLKEFSILDNGNLYVTSTDGNYVVKKEDYVHENLPTFQHTGNPEYDRLYSLFQDVDLYIVDLTPKN